MTSWSLRYRAAWSNWRHVGVDLEVSSDGSFSVVRSDGPGDPAERTRRAVRALDRVQGLGAEIADDAIVSSFEIRKQSVDLLAGVTLLVHPGGDTLQFSSRLVEGGHVEHWERWWAGLIEEEVRLVAAGDDVDDDTPPHPPTGAAVELVDALAHPVDSKEIAWRVAARWAMRYAVRTTELRGADTP